MPAPQETLDRVDATIRWLIAYRGLETEARRYSMGTASSFDRPGSGRPEGKADR
jgi:hypothetical protein